MKLITLVLTLAMITAASAQQTTFRDHRGKMTGTATTDSVGKTTYRDARGNITGTKDNSTGATTFRDVNGAIIGTVRTDGNRTYRVPRDPLTATKR
jgi:YD repeat-containing protein